MSEQELQELNKKLAEWTGFRLLPSERTEVAEDVWCWVEPDWVYGNGKWSFELPSFTQSLDACFKWLVPKAIAYIMTIMFKGMSEIKAREALLTFWLKQWDEEPALALCLAIEKLIDNKATKDND